MLPYGIDIRCSQISHWNGVPLGERGRSNSRNSPRKYASICRFASASKELGGESTFAPHSRPVMALLPVMRSIPIGVFMFIAFGMIKLIHVDMVTRPLSSQISSPALLTWKEVVPTVLMGAQKFSGFFRRRQSMASVFPEKLRLVLALVDKDFAPDSHPCTTGFAF